jgi:protein phosphatase
VTAKSDSPPGSIIVHVFGRTDVGRTREHNEDAFVVAELTTGNATLQPEVRTHALGERGTLFMVADGMGGAAAGEIASALATEVVLEELDARWRHASTATPENFVIALKAATEAANARIHRYAIEHPENRGMGTTATIAGIIGDTLYLAQVGDSRAYIVRNGVAIQITKDQSLMQKLVEAGELTAEEAEVSERRNIILQALGPEAIVKVDLTHQQVRRGDVLVLCSDGMSGQMRSADIAGVITEEPDLVAACKRLIDIANENGGPDNITVIAARFEGEGLRSPTDGENVGHRPYASESDSRATMRVSVNEMPALAAEIGAAPAEPPVLATADFLLSDQSTIVTAETPAAGAAAAGAAAAAAPAARRAGRVRRVSVGTLRIIFGAIAVGIAAWLLYYFRRR